MLPKSIKTYFAPLTQDQIAMKIAIAKCFQEDGLLGVAKLDATYQRARATLPANIDETLVIPGEVEAEEDLGPVAREEEEGVEVAANELVFEIEVVGDAEPTAVVDADDDHDIDDSSDTDSEVEVRAPVASSSSSSSSSSISGKRKRTANTMFGSVKGGKYSSSSSKF